jgi:hypothetical protein
MTVKISGLLLTIFLSCAATQACAEDSRTADPSTKECPDLTGTYEVRITAGVDKFSPFGRRARIQTKQFATFQRRGGGYTLIWHASRQDFLAAARSLAQRVDQVNPYRYDVWLDIMLRDPKLPLPLSVTSEEEWSNRLASVGPVFRGVDEVLPLKQCKRGWFLISGPGHRDGPPDFEGGMEGTRDLEIWLGHDKDGSLSLKVEEHRTLVLLKESLYTPHLDIHLRSSAHLDKWPVAPAQDLTPIREEELPGRIRPPRPIPKCQITGDHDAVFIHRLKARLPPKVEFEGYASSIDHGRMRPDGICDPTPYSVTVSAPDAATIAKVADYLRTDPFIRQIDSQESQVLWNGRLMVKFRMMAAP